MKYIILILIAAVMITGCASKPELNQVSRRAEEHPINTPEKAAEIQKKYGQ